MFNDHVQQGFGDLLKFIGILFIFHMVMLIINYVQYWRKNKKIRNVKECLQNIVRGEGFRMKAWVGIVMPNLKVDTADRVYYYPSRQLVQDSMVIVHERMRDYGYVRGSHRIHTRDCEDFARRMMVELHDILYNALKNNTELTGKGIPVGTFAYTKTSGQGHELMSVAISKNEVLYFEIFPEEKYLTPVILTESELKSGLRIF